VTNLQQHRPAKTAVTLESHIDLRDNALNLMRLVLASSVIVWHSFTVTGHPLANTHFGQLLGDMPVDGFFAISGFLLCASWFRKPTRSRATESCVSYRPTGRACCSPR
jgi:peptidoglycan/LPS O-acetylase OafA/YrhL